MAEHIEGRCLCGAVTVSVAGPVAGMSACHCDMCRRWTGSMLLGLEFPRDRVTIEGPIETYRSSSFAERAWCRICGSALWFASLDGGTIELTAGLFDNFAGARLTRVVYADRCPDGLVLGGGVDRVTQADYESGKAHVSSTAAGSGNG